MKRLAVLLALLVVSSSAHAAQQTGRIENARSLENACRPVEQKVERTRRRAEVPLVSGLLCLGYMQAMQDLSVLADEDGRRSLGACPAPQTTLRDLIQAFLTYARAHRGELDQNAAVVVIKAFRAAYPCPEEPTDASDAKKRSDAPPR